MLFFPSLFKKITVSFFFLFSLFFPLNAFAWDNMGHRVIAEIAYEHLTPAAKNRANELITYLANAYPYSSSFQAASTWPDMIRYDGIHTFDNWHYINIAFSTDGTTIQKFTTPNVVWAIQQSVSILQNPKSNQFEKALFLRFLIHFVGDIHQPLHCADRFTHEFPAGDNGGNLFPITGNFNNLHAAWDDGLGIFRTQCGFFKSKSQQARCFAHKFQTDYPENSFQQNKLNFNPDGWAQESFQLAKQIAYQTPENKPLSQRYIAEGQNIAERQITLAGYRLANLLNTLLG